MTQGELIASPAAAPRALSLTPWWCAIVAAGLKCVENRTWPTKFRGEFYIHASKGTPTEGAAVFAFVLTLPLELRKPAMGLLERFNQDTLPRGVIIARATLVDCITESDSPWFFGPYGFVLEDIQQTPVVACRGMLGFWKVPADVLAKLEAA